MTGSDSASRSEIELLSYVIDALRRQEMRHRINHWPVPAGTAGLLAEIGFRVTRGQGGAKSPPPPNKRQGGVTQSKLITYQEAATMLSISVRTLKRRIQTGLLTPVRDGGVVRLRPGDINAYIQNHHEETQ